MEIKPGIGISTLLFDTSMQEAEKVFGKADEVVKLDEIEDFQSTVWHYWEQGFSLFFDEQNKQAFCCVEIDNTLTEMWEKKIFDLNEKQIIELFKSKGINRHETEMQQWGEKRLSFDDVNIDFYFERNKLISINYGKISVNEPVLILSN